MSLGGVILFRLPAHLCFKAGRRCCTYFVNSRDLTIRSSRARFAVSDQPSRIGRAGLTQALGAHAESSRGQRKSSRSLLDCGSADYCSGSRILLLVAPSFAARLLHDPLCSGYLLRWACLATQFSRQFFGRLARTLIGSHPCRQLWLCSSSSSACPSYRRRTNLWQPQRLIVVRLTIRSSRARFAVSDQPSRIARAGLTQALGLAKASIIHTMYR